VGLRGLFLRLGLLALGRQVYDWGVSVIEGKSKLKELSIDAVVVRADGSRENLGTVSFWHKDPLKRLAWKVGKWRQ